MNPFTLAAILLAGVLVIGFTWRALRARKPQSMQVRRSGLCAVVAAMSGVLVWYCKDHMWAMPWVACGCAAGIVLAVVALASTEIEARSDGLFYICRSNAASGLLCLLLMRVCFRIFDIAEGQAEESVAGGVATALLAGAVVAHFAGFSVGIFRAAASFELTTPARVENVADV